MAYIGNAKTPLLLASNVRDDLIPGDIVNGRCTKTTFALSQEVPGGEESNVTVVRRKFLADNLISNTNFITITRNQDTTTLTTTDNYLAAALSIVQPRSSNYEGDDIQVTANNITLNAIALSVTYTRDSIQIVLNKSLDFGQQVTDVSLTRRYYGAWEILDPKTDYRIEGQFNTPLFNKQIVLADAPQIDDLIYVLHRGDATYNFVPSPYSVGIEQLSNNLKNFRCDRFVVGTDIPPYIISQNAINEKTLLVTVNGIIKEGDDLTQQFIGDWKLVDSDNDTQAIEFHEELNSGDKIRVLHLGFVAGLRRAAFAPGQEPTTIQYRSITEEKISDDSVLTRTIQNGAVTTQKLQDSAVTAQKILLNATQNDGLRITYSDGIKKLIGVESTSTGFDTHIHTKTNFAIKTDQQNLLTVSSSAILPGTTNTTSLGNETNKFSNLHLSGAATVEAGLSVGQGASITGTTSVIGNTNIVGDTSISGVVSIVRAPQETALSVLGNISVTGTVDNVDVSALYNAVQELQQKVSTLIPIGTIMASSNTTHRTQGGVWLLCNGDEVNIVDYPELFEEIRYTFGGAGNKFRLPDLRRRVAVGKSDSDNIGNTEELPVANRSLTHTHTSAPHTHSLSAHTHPIPGHKHSITSTSTLKIESTQSKPSGGHTTNISHSHGANTTTTSAYNTANTAASTFSHTHQFGHSHSGTTGDGGIDHYHAASTTSDGNHSHTISDPGHTHAIARKASAGGFGNIAAVAYPNSSGTDGWINTDSRATGISINTAGSGHGHTISVGWSYNPSYANGYSHTHPFSTSWHEGTTQGPNSGNNSLDHIHRFTVQAYTGNSSDPANGTDGAHSHAADTFSGFIGNLSGSEGNNSFSSQGPSVDVTGIATYDTNNSAGLTGEAQAPYMILNFIIKAKNS